MFLLVSMLQFVAHGSRLDSMAIVWARFFENFASCLQGRNEVGWRLGQAASLAPMFERKVFWMQIFPLKKVLVTLWDFLTPSSSYSAFWHPHRDLAPEELCPPLCPHYVPACLGPRCPGCWYAWVVESFLQLFLWCWMCVSDEQVHFFTKQRWWQKRWSSPLCAVHLPDGLDAIFDSIWFLSNF